MMMMRTASTTLLLLLLAASVAADSRRLLREAVRRQAQGIIVDINVTDADVDVNATSAGGAGVDALGGEKCSCPGGKEGIKKPVEKPTKKLLDFVCDLLDKSLKKDGVSGDSTETLFPTPSFVEAQGLLLCKDKKEDPLPDEDTGKGGKGGSGKGMGGGASGDEVDIDEVVAAEVGADGFLEDLLCKLLKKDEDAVGADAATTLFPTPSFVSDQGFFCKEPKVPKATDAPVAAPTGKGGSGKGSSKGEDDSDDDEDGGKGKSGKGKGSTVEECICPEDDDDDSDDEDMMGMGMGKSGSEADDVAGGSAVGVPTPVTVPAPVVPSPPTFNYYNVWAMQQADEALATGDSGKKGMRRRMQRRRR